MTTARTREPMRLARAIAAGGDTRLLKSELIADNRYAHAYIARRGLAYDRDRGAIVRRDTP